MPKKAVLLFFVVSFLGACLFVALTFPMKGRNYWPSKGQAPVVQNLQHLQSQAGVVLNVVTWGTSAEVAAFKTRLEAWEQQTGMSIHVQVLADNADDYAASVAASHGKLNFDVAWVDPLDFSGFNPGDDLAVLPPVPSSDAPFVPSLVHACQAAQALRAYPVEVATEALYYNRDYILRSGVAEPGNHWNLDIMESMARALSVQGYKNSGGQVSGGIEINPSFLLWNTLCAEAGGAVLDETGWHLGNPERRNAQLRGLDFFKTYFHDLSVVVPTTWFRQQRAVFGVTSSDHEAELLGPQASGSSRVGMVPFPKDMALASSVTVGAWSVAASTTHRPDALTFIRSFLLQSPMHATWFPARLPSDASIPGQNEARSLEADREEVWRTMAPRLVVPESIDAASNRVNSRARIQAVEKLLARFAFEAAPHQSEEMVYTEIVKAVGPF